MTELIIQKKPETLAQLKISKSNLHLKIANGTYPPPIKLGAKAVGFLQHETQAMIVAWVRGLSETELKSFVRHLIANRRRVI